MLEFEHGGYLIRFLICVATAALLTACSSQPARDTSAAEFQRAQLQQSRVENLNQQLAMRSLAGGATESHKSDSYQLGPGDLVTVTVLGVPELSRDVRVDGNGSIALPLIGEVLVAGKTVAEASDIVAKRYGKSYLQHPQVSVLVKEYRSMRVTVLGAVQEPKVYAAEHRIGILEALALAGGLTEKAGSTVFVNDVTVDPDTSKRVHRNLIIDLDKLIDGGSKAENITLGDGAVVNVPQAGVVYVEGAVTKPGVYPLHKETSVLKAVAMAGGLEFEANGSDIHVLRVSENGIPQKPVGPIDIDELRKNPGADIKLQNGDVVVVGTSAMKSVLQGVVNTTRGFFGFGYRL